MSDTTQPMLKTYGQEREQLLRRAQEVLEDDDRVVAAWLFGSLGRGQEDELSDLDLFVVVADRHLAAIVANPIPEVQRIGSPILILNAPQNRPPGGAYRMALYDGQSGPHQIDWYWQAQSAGRIPQQTRILFDRVGLPHLDTPPQLGYQPVPEQTPEEQAGNSVCFFWVMLLITAKYMARSPSEQGMGLLTYAQGALANVRKFLEARSSSQPDDASALTLPAEKLRLLRRLAGEMEELMPLVAARGGAVPTAVIPSAHRYLQLVEAIMPRH